MNKIKRANRSKLSIVSIFASISLVLMILGIVFVVNLLVFKEKAVKVEAEVVDVRIEYDSDGDKYKEVYVTYEYEGRLYEYVELKDKTKKDEGSIISIYVNPEKPYKPRASVVPIGGIILICMSLVIMIITGPGYGDIIKEKKNRKKLMAEGMVIQAIVDTISYDDSLTVNGRNPYILKCYYDNIYSGGRYDFTSESVWNNLEFYFKPGDLIDVYVLHDDYNRYYIDLEQCMNSVKVIDFT